MQKVLLSCLLCNFCWYITNYMEMFSQLFNSAKQMYTLVAQYCYENIVCLFVMLVDCDQIH